MKIQMTIGLLATVSTMIFQTSLARAEMDAGACSDAQKSRTVTSHTALLNGATVAYEATTGFIEVTSNDRSAKACVFYTSYRVPTNSTNPRPLTFAFNGGPGSSSVWLHLGLLGPKRVDMGADGLHAPTNPALIDNESSLLDVSDIVMIDPVATGFSHTTDGASSDKFFGVKNDYTSIAAFIENYLNVNKRWLSPKFILGESYGGIRGTLLTNYLQNEMNIRIDGLILVSPALSNTTFFFASDNLVPYWTYFPTFAATAWFHHKGAFQNLALSEVFENARAFASGQLRDALDQGSDLDESAADTVAQRISDYLGFPKAEILANHLRVDDASMFTGLLRAEGLNIGRYDARFSEQKSGPEYKDDPSGSQTGFAFAAGINDYLRTELGVTSASPYNIFGEITSWPEGPGGTWDVMPAMSQSLSVNPHLKVLIASGYYDLACPLETVSYELRQMPNSAKFRSRIMHTRYDGGHMMYINPPALQTLKSDIAQLITTQARRAMNRSPFLRPNAKARLQP